MKALYILLISLTFSAISNAQEIGFPIIRNYTPKEYQNSPVIFSALQDNRGMMYFGVDGGVIEYDGVSWRTIPNEKKTYLFDLAKDENGRIYLAATDDFGYLKYDKIGNTIYQPLTHLLNDTTHKIGIVWSISITSNLVYFLTNDAIFQYSPDNEKIAVFKADNNGKFLGDFVFNNIYYVRLSNKGLMKIEQNQLVCANQSEFFQNKNTFRVATPFSANSLLIPTRTEGMYLYQPDKDSTLQVFTLSDKDFITDNNIYNVSRFQNEYFVVGSVDKGALLFDKQGTILQRYNENSFLQSNIVREIVIDQSQNIWLGLESGFSKTEYSLDLSYWDKNAGVKGSVFAIDRFNGKLYIATSTKMYFIDENNQVAGIKNRPVGHNWCLLEFNDNNSLLVGSSNGLYEIKGDIATQIYKGAHATKLYQSVKNPLRIFSTDNDDFISLRFENCEWVSEGKWDGIKDGIRGIAEDENGDLWLGTFRNGVIRVTPNFEDITKPKKARYYNLNDGFTSLKSILPFTRRNKIVWGTEKGLFIYNSQTDRFEPFCELGNEFCNGSRDIFSLIEMPDGKIWICPKENGKADIGYLQPNGNGGYDWVYVPFRRIPEMIIESFYVESSGIAWVGGSEGIFRYDMSKDTKNYNQSFNCLIRKVAVNEDSIIYGGNASSTNPLVLSYEFNTLKFDYAAPFFDQEEKTMYCYKLVGYDKEWSKWSRYAEKEYKYLREGAYTFEVKARNVYNVESVVSTFQITILPPFYRTWWAYGLYLILLTFFIILVVKFYTHRLHKQKVQLELIVKEKTAKVVHQQEELQAFNEELFATNEELHNQREELETTLQSLQDTQKQLVQSEKMASIGVLTAGIAHEINNPINFVYAGANSLMRDFIDIEKVLNAIKNIEKSTLKPDEIVQQISNIKTEVDFDEAYNSISITLNDIMLGAQRTAEIVQGLRNFSRNEEGKFEFSNINTIIERVLVLLRNKYKNHVEIIKNLNPELPDVECKEGKINQVLMNIISNAIDAINEKGEIEITTQVKGNMCSISVKDNGIGIDEDTLPKIFDPFYTTKKVGQGTGLGLSISYGIILEHNGKIDVRSHVSKGTEFIITIPLKH